MPSNIGRKFRPTIKGCWVDIKAFPPSIFTGEEGGHHRLVRQGGGARAQAGHTENLSIFSSPRSTVPRTFCRLSCRLLVVAWGRGECWIAVPASAASPSTSSCPSSTEWTWSNSTPTSSTKPGRSSPLYPPVPSSTAASRPASKISPRIPANTTSFGRSGFWAISPTITSSISFGVVSEVRISDDGLGYRVVTIPTVRRLLFRFLQG